MRKSLYAIAIIAALAAIFAPVAQPLETKGNSIVLSEKEVADCQAGGGCVLVTVKTLDSVVATIRDLRSKIGKSCA